VKRLSTSLLGCLCLLGASLHADTPVRLHSPSGKFDVTFEPKERRLYRSPQERSLPEGIKSQVYSISFYPTGMDAAVAVTYFTDIQPTPESRFPVPLSALAKRIFWSPNDDFAVLPVESWPHPNETPALRQAISLRSDSVWQTSDFPFSEEPLVWVTPIRVQGNVVNGCRLEVSEFDGHSGRTFPVQAANPPEGYQISSVNGGQIVLKKVLGSCATDEDKHNFHEECMTLNVSFGRREIGPCPP
jgi:hypothetical protein